MFPKRTALFVLIILAAILLILAGVFWGLPHLGFSEPRPLWDKQGVGAYGPLRIQFPREMNTASVEKAIELSPSVEGEGVWEGNQFLFFPRFPLRQGVEYTLTIHEGIKSSDGRTLKRSLAWNFTVRTPMLAYLSPSGSAEIVTRDLNTGITKTLTNTGGQVFDYAVSPDGEWLVYSAFNELKGMDLWKVRRDGTESQKILDCGADWCINPAFHPHGSMLAYSRRLAPLQEGAEPGVPHVWLFDLSSGTTQRLSPDPNVSGSEPLWAPKGRRLLMWDGLSGGLRGVDLDAQKSILIPSEMGMSAAWTPDGEAILFIRMVIEEASAYSEVYRYDWNTQSAEKVLGSSETPWDYGIPVFSPDGQWMAMGVREVQGSPARQLWLFRPDGSEGTLIAGDPLINFSSFHWHPQGNAIALQKITLGNSSARPQVAVLDLTSRTITLMADDATFPQWIP